MKKKKSIIIVVVCVLAAAGIAAGIYGMTRKKGSPEAVNDLSLIHISFFFFYRHCRGMYYFIQLQPVCLEYFIYG